MLEDVQQGAGVAWGWHPESACPWRHSWAVGGKMGAGMTSLVAQGWHVAFGGTGMARGVHSTVMAQGWHPVFAPLR